MLATLLLALSPALAPAEEPSLRGVLLTCEGEVAAGARIVLAGPSEQTFDRIEVYEDLVLAQDGRFELVIPERWIALRGWKSLDLFAWREGSGLAISSYEVHEVPLGQELTLRLPPPGDRTFEIRNQEGSPMSGARVSVRSYSTQNLPEPVRLATSAVADEAGVAHLPFFGDEPVNYFEVETGGEAGTQEFSHWGGWPSDWPVRMQPCGRVRVDVRGEPPSSPVETSIRLQTYVELNGDGSPGRSAQSSTLLPSTAARSGTVLPVPAAETLHHTVRLASPSEVLPVVTAARIEAGETAVFTVEWTPGIPVTGTLVEEETDEPLAGVGLEVRGRGGTFRVQSDARGRIAFHALPPVLFIRGVDARAGHLSPGDLWNTLRIEIPEDVDRLELDPIRLPRGVRIRGFVLDAGGARVAGAWVHARQEKREERFTRVIQYSAVANRNGAFVIEGVQDGLPLEFGARLGFASTAESTVVSVFDGTAVELVIRDASQVGVVGRIHAEGRPVAGAQVEVWQASPENVIGGERRMPLGGQTWLPTDAEGAFDGPPCLMPGQSYRLQVRGPGIRPRFSEWFTGAELAAGVELGVEELAAIEGRARTPDGEPIVGARILVASDTLERVEATTDEEGRFSLPGVFEEGLVVLEHPELGVRGRRYDAAARLDWVVRSQPRGLAPLPPAVPREQERLLARRALVADVQRARESGVDSTLMRALQRLVWIDPGAVLEILDEDPFESENYAGYVLSRIPRALAREDPEDALTIAQSLESISSAIYGIVEVVEALPASEHTHKIELLSLAKAKLSLVEDPAHRLAALSRIGETFHDIGEAEAARELYDRGEELAAKLPAEEWAGFARATFAEELASFDLEAALELVKPMDRMDQGRHLGNIAHELADREPEAAERVLEDLGNQSVWERRRYEPRVCYRMASVDLERARRIAGGSRTAGHCYGVMACALADRDPTSARELLETAFERLEGEARGAGEIGKPAIIASSLLTAVEAVAPERLEEYLWRSLMLRPLRSKPDEYDSWRAYLRADATVAFYVARYDRALAGALLDPALEFLIASDGDRDSHEWKAGYAALAVIDPARALELAASELPPRALGVVGSVLAREGEERRRYVQDEHVNLWVIGKEDL